MLLRPFARSLLGSHFVVSGFETALHPGSASSSAKPLVEKGLAALPEEVARSLPSDPELYVRATSAVQLVAGLALTSGRLPRVASLVLAGTVIPTTLVGHAFWKEPNPNLKAQQKAHFWKNVSILGGLIIAGVDTEGRPGLSWRARRAARRATAAVASVLPAGAQHPPALTEKAHEFADAAQAFAEDARHRGVELADVARKKVPALAEDARRRGSELAEATAKGREQLEALAAEQSPKLRRRFRALGF